MFVGMLFYFFQIILALDRNNRRKKFRNEVNFEANPLSCLLYIPKIHPSDSWEQMGRSSHQIQLSSE